MQGYQDLMNLIITGFQPTPYLKLIGPGLKVLCHHSSDGGTQFPHSEMFFTYRFYQHFRTQVPCQCFVIILYGEIGRSLPNCLLA